MLVGGDTGCVPRDPAKWGEEDRPFDTPSGSVMITLIEGGVVGDLSYHRGKNRM